MSDNKLSVIGLGELLWDHFLESGESKPGGAPANVAYHASQLNCHGFVASRIGTDKPGKGIDKYLRENGVDVSLVQRDEQRETGLVEVDDRVQDQARYDIKRGRAWDFIEPEPHLLEKAAEAQAICFGSLAQRGQTSRNTIRSVIAAARRDCLIVFDVNLRPGWEEFVQLIPDSMPLARIVKVNHEEVVSLAPLMRVDEFAGHLQRKFGVEIVCVTRADAGCLLFRDDERIDLPGVRFSGKARPTGAGDAFTAALITATLHGWPLRSAGQFANAVGSFVASKDGAMPPGCRKAYETLWKQHRPK